MSHLLFVYGTLKRGFSNHELLRDQSFEGEVRTVPDYGLFLLDLYPALAPGAGRSILDELDAFEGEAYRRAPIALSDGRTVQAYIAAPRTRERARLLDVDEWRE